MNSKDLLTTIKDVLTIKVCIAIAIVLFLNGILFAFIVINHFHTRTPIPVPINEMEDNRDIGSYYY